MDKEDERTPGQFRKKPVVIDAVQLRQRFPWPDWFHDAVSGNTIITHGLGKYGTGDVYCEIKTLEGVMRADDGDWIIRGVKGEIYPCKPDIFIETYEPADSAEACNSFNSLREALAEGRQAAVNLASMMREGGHDKEEIKWCKVVDKIDAALKGVPQPASDDYQADASAPALSENVNGAEGWQPEGSENLMALLDAIQRLEKELPGWWWSVGSCHVSADASIGPINRPWTHASIGPDSAGRDAHLLEDKLFDGGFHCDLRQPATCAESLNQAIDEALAARRDAELNFSNEAERDGVSLKTDTSSQPASEAGKLTSAANDVLAERERQKAVEGWTPEHDDTHTHFEMARAAAFYALHTAADILPEPSSDAPSDRYGLFLTADMAWPPQWDRVTWKKPKSARRNLVRAAALLIAEIERLDRAEAGKLSTDEVAYNHRDEADQ